MIQFSHALCRAPADSLAQGLTTAGLGTPDLVLARAQHAGYVAALAACGLGVSVLPPLPDHPDSCFLEDAALLFPEVMVVTRPGAPSRRGETAAMATALGAAALHLPGPGTLDGGDVLVVGRRVFVGLSERTNATGVAALADLLEPHGLQVVPVDLAGVLHLKTAVNVLADDLLLAHGPLAGHPAFSGYRVLPVPDAEAYAANSLRINDRVLVPAEHPRTAALLAAQGFDVVPVALSEFQKLDGGLSCLSLRVPAGAVPPAACAAAPGPAGTG